MHEIVNISQPISVGGERMKYEIANEFGVNLGPDTTSRANGSVGGEITKRLVQLGQNQISGSNYQAK